MEGWERHHYPKRTGSEQKRPQVLQANLPALHDRQIAGKANGHQDGTHLPWPCVVLGQTIRLSPWKIDGGRYHQVPWEIRANERDSSRTSVRPRNRARYIRSLRQCLVAQRTRRTEKKRLPRQLIPVDKELLLGQNCANRWEKTKQWASLPRKDARRDRYWVQVFGTCWPS